MADDTTILVNDLRYRWPGADSSLDKDTLNIPEWQVNRGSRTFLYGPSGSGKSTLLNILAGILQAQQGQVKILDKDLGQLSASQRDRFRAQHIGVIFQQFNLIPYLSVADNIRLSQYFSHRQYDQERLFMLMEQLRLDNDLLTKQANQLSVGQQQRIAIARALYHQPELIIADEPTSSLDAENRDTFIELLLKQCQQSSSTVLFVSHDKSLAKHFDQAINLGDINQVGQGQSGKGQVSQNNVI